MWARLGGQIDLALILRFDPAMTARHAVQQSAQAFPIPLQPGRCFGAGSFLLSLVKRFALASVFLCHKPAFFFNLGQAGVNGRLLPLMQRVQMRPHGLGNLPPGFCDRWQGGGIAQSGAHLLCADTHPFGNGKDFACMVQRHKTPPVAPRQGVAPFFQGLPEGALAVADRSAFPKHPLDRFRVFAGPFGLLPLLQRKIGGVPFFGAHKAAWHGPAMFHIEFARNIHQLAFGEGQGNRLHLFRIDPRPDGVAVTAAFLFMKDDGARWVGEAELVFDPRNGVLEHSGRDVGIRRRIKA